MKEARRRKNASSTKHQGRVAQDLDGYTTFLTLSFGFSCVGSSFCRLLVEVSIAITLHHILEDAIRQTKFRYRPPPLKLW